MGLASVRHSGTASRLLMLLLLLLLLLLLQLLLKLCRSAFSSYGPPLSP
jgi:hypothetical protein